MKYLHGHSCVICGHELIFVCGILRSIFVAHPYMAKMRELCFSVDDICNVVVIFVQ